MKTLLRSASLAAICLICLLAGCSIEGWQLEKATKDCKEHGGIHRVDPKLGDATFTCADGTETWFSKK